ncbi:MAG TPA: DUF4235 domain-containing protein [Solirubrobacterales bacterium]|nr:DUF4235 domain-containing protein [Solirubrobacterales bacterium]
MRFIFAPIGIAVGLVAGSLGKKAFERVWGMIDDEEPPQPEHREINWPKLIAALAMEGAIFRLAKGVTDHQVRRSFAGLTGSWPGEEAPQPK